MLPCDVKIEIGPDTPFGVSRSCATGVWNAPALNCEIAAVPPTYTRRTAVRSSAFSGYAFTTLGETGVGTLCTVNVPDPSLLLAKTSTTESSPECGKV